MDAVVEVLNEAEDHFEGACALLNLGDKQKFIRLRKKSQVISLPASKSSSPGKIFGSVEILRKITSGFLGLDLESLDQEVQIPCPEVPSGHVRLRFRAASAKDAAEAATPATPGTKVRPGTASQAVDAESYLSSHGLHELLSAAVQAVLGEKPENPREFLANFIGGVKYESGQDAKDSQTATTATPSPDSAPTPVLSGSDVQDGVLVEQAEQVSPVQVPSPDMYADLLAMCQRHEASLTEMRMQMGQLAKDSVLTFSVMQYNILANYLADNRQPWLLYGADVSEELRGRILKKFYEKDEAGKYVNVGWPNYVQDLLSEEQQMAVEQTQRLHFDWSIRRKRLIDEIQASDCDIMSLVEMDEYEDFQGELATQWDGIFRKRPRESSKDGCAIFWRRVKFSFIAQDGFDFVDMHNEETGQMRKDRSCLIALLACRGAACSRVIVISTHLARNPECRRQTMVRAKQAAQLMKRLTDFADKHNAENVPVVLMGDLNAQHFGEIRGIARSVFQVSDHPCHPFLFRCADVPTGPTSITDVRNVRIDAIMYSPSSLKVLEVGVPELVSKIPDATHPSDHVPVRVRFQMKSDHKIQRECAVSWLECVTGEHRIIPMTDKEVKRAFAFFDREGVGKIDRHALEEACLDLGVFLQAEVQESLLRCFPDETIGFKEFQQAYAIELHAGRARGVGDLEHAFKFFDTDNDGKLKLQELLAAFREIIPIEFSKTEVESLAGQIEVDENGEVDIEMFCQSMCDANFKARRNRFLGRTTSNRHAAELEGRLREFRTDMRDLSPSSPIARRGRFAPQTSEKYSFNNSSPTGMRNMRSRLSMSCRR
eukprot:CAMPEP_0178372250 /NCGR_PEP_ID=MMETSP0689_2-20121128/1254_1 /TAXON_ID=160604 /ORGANISM="Amphidinium massartii, Strain CS-259" /LENGTH=826 /DNA_ID=CAMNT_0019992163 /DNA_START=82 /DNA_END=2559 /DNA_ORIENTATION=+